MPHNPSSDHVTQYASGYTITGIDERNVGLLIKSVQHAAGRRQFP
jgi:hypothetical protein